LLLDRDKVKLLIRNELGQTNSADNGRKVIVAAETSGMAASSPCRFTGGCSLEALARAFIFPIWSELATIWPIRRVARLLAKKHAESA